MRVVRWGGTSWHARRATRRLRPSRPQGAADRPRGELVPGAPSWRRDETAGRLAGTGGMGRSVRWRRWLGGPCGSRWWLQVGWNVEASDRRGPGVWVGSPADVGARRGVRTARAARARCDAGAAGWAGGIAGSSRWCGWPGGACGSGSWRQVGWNVSAHALRSGPGVAQSSGRGPAVSVTKASRGSGGRRRGAACPCRPRIRGRLRPSKSIAAPDGAARLPLVTPASRRVASSTARCLARVGVQRPAPPGADW